MSTKKKVALGILVVVVALLVIGLFASDDVRDSAQEGFEEGIEVQE